MLREGRDALRRVVIAASLLGVSSLWACSGAAETAAPGATGSLPSPTTVPWSGAVEVPGATTAGAARCTRDMTATFVGYEDRLPEADLTTFWGDGFPIAGKPPRLYDVPSPPTSPIDWDLDGQPDGLDVRREADEVRLTWATGELTVTGVDGYLTSELRGVDTSTMLPAAVADVTGDGWPDLAIADAGEVAVLAGAGPASPTGTIPFADVGRATLGWHRRPTAVSGPGRRTYDGLPVQATPQGPKPSAGAQLLPVFDVSGDGVVDLKLVEPSTIGAGSPQAATYLASPACSTAGLAGTATPTTLAAPPPTPCAQGDLLQPTIAAWIPPDKRVPLPGVVYDRPVETGDPVAPRRTFDWDDDGRDDRVVVQRDGAAGSVTVDFGSGRVTVTDLRTDYTGLHPYSTMRESYPFDVGDVTGDGFDDLLLIHDQRLAVLVGRGPAAMSETVHFADIGTAAAGWVVGPTDIRAPSGSTIRLPSSEAEPRVGAGDFTGDGIPDIVVVNHGSRSADTPTYAPGRPCPPT